MYNYPKNCKMAVLKYNILLDKSSNTFIIGNEYDKDNMRLFMDD